MALEAELLRTGTWSPVIPVEMGPGAAGGDNADIRSF
jgi:hypothetical protein